MISKKLDKMFSEQIRNEYYSAYLYLGMAAWLESKNLPGFANWYYVQAREETDHAKMMLDYMLRVGGKITFLPIDAPPLQFSAPMDILKKGLEHEQFVTKKIYELMETAQEEHDFKTIQFLQWYVSEQAEEEDNASGLIARLKLAQDAQGGILYMDNELLSRTYAPPSIMQNADNT